MCVIKNNYLTFLFVIFRVVSVVRHALLLWLITLISLLVYHERSYQPFHNITPWLQHINMTTENGRQLRETGHLQVEQQTDNWAPCSSAILTYNVIRSIDLNTETENWTNPRFISDNRLFGFRSFLCFPRQAGREFWEFPHCRRDLKTIFKSYSALVTRQAPIGCWLQHSLPFMWFHFLLCFCVAR